MRNGNRDIVKHDTYSSVKMESFEERYKGSILNFL